jgi:hypothetical protein
MINISIDYSRYIALAWIRTNYWDNPKLFGVFLDRYRNVMSMCSFSLTYILCEPSSGIADGFSAVTARVYRHQPPGWSRWKYG